MYSLFLVYFKVIFSIKGKSKRPIIKYCLFCFWTTHPVKNTWYKYIILKNINTIYFLFLLKNLNLHVSVTIQTFCDIFPYIIHQHHQGKGFPTFCKTFGSKKQKYYLAVVIFLVYSWTSESLTLALTNYMGSRSPVFCHFPYPHCFHQLFLFAICNNICIM